MWCDDTMRPFAGHHHGRRMSVLSDPTPQPADLPPAGAPVSARAPIWRLAQDIAFGRDADRTATQGAGWAPPLAAKCWTDGTQSELCLRHGGAADLVLEIDAAPFLGASALASQRLIVHVNGWPAGELLCRDGRRRALHLNGAAIAGQSMLRLSFSMPDACSPAALGLSDNDRLHGFCFSRLRVFEAAPAAVTRHAGTGGVKPEEVQALCGLTPDALALRFESLGDSCELGLVQRRLGAEPLGLFRFASMDLPPLLRGLAADFAGLDDPQRLDVILREVGRREYVIRHRDYGLTFHTWQNFGEVDPQSLPAQQAKRLRFLWRKLQDDMALGEKIFVVRRNPARDPLPEAEVLPLLMALNQHGPCTLLWISLADAENPCGTVRRTAPGLLRGYIDRLAPNDNTHHFSFEPWVEICANAVRLQAPPETLRLSPGPQQAV
jgi:hypothetical protein